MDASFVFVVFVGVCFSFTDGNVTQDATDHYAEKHPEEFGDYFQGDMIIDGNIRNALTQKSKVWPGGRVYYIIDKNAGYTTKNLNDIKKAMAILRKKTCIRWIERTEQKSFVKIIRGKGCYSVLGRSSKNGKPQPLSLGTGCLGLGTILHEMLHAIGFIHEQSSADRDDYVKFNYDNIQKGRAGNFKKFGSKSVQDLGVPYDYGSLMHYGKKAFSKNKQNTITPKDSSIKQLGQRRGLSKSDFKKVNTLYKCNN